MSFLLKRLKGFTAERPAQISSMNDVWFHSWSLDLNLTLSPHNNFLLFLFDFFTRNYHFFVRLAQRIQTQNSQLGNNCSEASGSINGGGTILSPPTQAHPSGHHSSHGGSRRGYAAKCTPKLSSQPEPTVGCALYGLTNLKSFSDPLNFTDVPYCSLSGAWSLLDMDAVAVQITNKGGLSPLPKDITTTTLVRSTGWALTSNKMMTTLETITWILISPSLPD